MKRNFTKNILILAMMLCVIALSACRKTGNDEPGNNGDDSQHIHSFQNYVSNNDATCEEDGTKTGECSCGQSDTVYDEGSALGHNITIYCEAKEPTCTSDGWEAYDKCSRCTYSPNYFHIASLGHDLIYCEAKSATCTEAGYSSYEECSRCQYQTYSYEYPAIGHNYQNEYDDINHWNECMNCEDKLDIKEHTFDENSVCINCGYGCEHEEGIAATCTQKAICSKCEFPYGEILNHSFTNYISDENATYTEDGTKTAICDREGCGEPDTVVDENSALLIFKTYSNGYSVSGVRRKGLKEIEIPNEYNGLQILNIGNSAFYDCALQNLTIPESITSIGRSAFYNCYNLKSITIPENVTSIDNAAFYNCTALTEIHYNATALNDLSKDNYLFYNAGINGDGIKVTIGMNVTKIPENLFYSSIFYSERQPKITSVVFEEGSKCESVGDYAFRECRSLTSIEIPDSVISIGAYAFDDCYGLQSITLPFTGATRDEIYDDHFGYIFGARSSMENKTYVPASLKTVIITGDTEIDGHAFIGCSYIQSITIPDSVTSIGGSAFENCSSLTNINIHQSVTSIGYSAFYGCSSLTSINIPDSVTEIGSSAFSGCSSLASIVIPDGVTLIEGRTFSRCSSLTSINIPDSVTSIGGAAFYGCSSLTSVNIPKSVKSIGEYAFYNCIALTEIYYNAEKAALDFSSEYNYIFYNAGTAGKGITLTIGKNVTKIPAYLFYPYSEIGYLYQKITNIVFEEGSNCKSIGAGAFEKCEYLKNVYITDIASWCAIEFADYYSNPLFYADNLYLNNELVTELVIPEGVTKIGSYAFCDYQKITRVKIPESVTSIGDDAFSCCKLIEVINKSSLNIRAGYDDYGFVASYAKQVIKDESESNIIKQDDYIFYNDNVIYYLLGYIGTDTNLVLPDDINGNSYAIYKYAFYDCDKLDSVAIGNGVTSIGNYAFYICDSLTSITIPESVTNIGDHAFVGCYKLIEVINKSSLNIKAGSSDYGNVAHYAKKVIKDESESNIIKQDDYIFYNDNGSYYLLGYIGTDTDLVLPDDINGNSYSIYGWAFLYCSSLTSINIPGSVTSIGDAAFYGCSSLTSITIPDGVTSIGDAAFRNCSSLTSINIPDSVISIGNNAFINCSSLTSINIPDGVTLIGNWAFFGCSSLTSINIPDSVTSIGDWAFMNCSSLSSINIPDSVTSIGEHAFSGCSSLTSVTFENPNGWYVTEDANAESGTDLVLTDAEQNANYLRDTYYNYYWYRK